MPRNENDEFVVCPVCGAKLTRLVKHCSQMHGLSRDDLERTYPGIKLSTDKSFKIRSDISKKTCSDPEFKAKHSERFKEMHRNGHNQSEFMREVSRIHCREKFGTPEAIAKSKESRRRTYETNEEFRNKVLRSLDKGRTKNWNNPEYRKMMSDLHKEKWNSDPEYRKNWMKKCCFRSTRFNYTNSKGETLKLRSSWERRFIDTLDSLNLNYNYESLEIDYEDLSGNSHKYYPDFYLPEYNLICEVHPYYRIDDIMIKKKDACINSGYKFLFITGDLLESNPLELLDSK